MIETSEQNAIVQTPYLIPKVRGGAPARAAPPEPAVLLRPGARGPRLALPPVLPRPLGFKNVVQAVVKKKHAALVTSPKIGKYLANFVKLYLGISI